MKSVYFRMSPLRYIYNVTREKSEGLQHEFLKRGARSGTSRRRVLLRQCPEFQKRGL